MRSLDIGATGMLAQQMNVDVISNNIANMTTSGFKRQRLEFQDLIYQNKQVPGSSGATAGSTIPTGIQLGLGVKPVSTHRLHTQGSIENTGNDFDLAITGDGYFQIDLPTGETGYTRSGSFGRNENGEVVTAQGYIVQPGITIPAEAVGIEINASGEVLIKIPGQVGLQNVGQFQTAKFVNPGGLEAIGNTTFLETNSSGAPITGTPNEDDFGALLQGSLETSNVNVVEEITKLITAQRSYEMNSNVISTSDEMMQTASQI